MDFYAAFILGLAGSLHCAGMCGPLVLALPVSNNSSTAQLGRVAYHLGRITTYCVLGVVFGLVGHTLSLAGLQRWVSITLGMLLLAGVLGSRKLALWRPATMLVEKLKSHMTALLHRRSFVSVLVLGLLNGLLPCGLVYVACAGATATGALLSGAAYMAAFGAGTVPMLLAISFSGRLISPRLRLKLLKAVPISILLVAGLLILRGMGLGIPYVSPDLSSASPACCRRP